MAKAEKMNRTNKPAAQKVEKLARVIESGGAFVAWQAGPKGKRLGSSPDRAEAERMAVMRGYTVLNAVRS